MIRLLRARLQLACVNAWLAAYYWAVDHHQWWLAALLIRWSAPDDIQTWPSMAALRSNIRSTWQPAADAAEREKK